MGQTPSEMSKPLHPEPRQSHNSAVVDGQMFVWGGCVAEGEVFRYFSHEKIWSLNLAEKSWAKRLATCKREKDLPRQFYGSGIAIYGNEEIYQFGGAHQPSRSSPVELSNDFHILDGMTLEWKQIFPKGRIPEERSYCGLCILENHLVMMGGAHGIRDYRNDLWRFSLKEELWTEVECRGKRPSPRCQHSFTAIDENRAVLIGGIVEGKNGCQDSFMLNLKNKEWIEILAEVGPDRPTPRFWHSAVCADIPGIGKHLFVFWGSERWNGKLLLNAVVIDITTMNYRKIEIPDLLPSIGQTVCFLSAENEMLHFIRFGGVYGTRRPGPPLDILTWDVNFPRKLEKVDINECAFSVFSDLAETLDKKATVIDGNLKMELDDLVYDEEVDFIGGGSFGEVYRGKLKETDELAAVKVLLKRKRTSNESKELQKEVSILLKIRPYLHIVRLIGVCDSPRCYALVMELVSGGDLKDLLVSADPEVEKWKTRLDVSCQVAMGMAHLHRNSPPVIHLDLKPNNVLIERIVENTRRPFLCKICDFGISKMSGVSSITTDRPMGSTPAGTVVYVAPERYFAYGQGTKEAKMETAKKSDVFSFGVLLWEILERRAPFEGMEADSIRFHIKSGEPLPAPQETENVPMSYIKLQKICSSKNPRDRPSFVEVIKQLVNMK